MYKIIALCGEAGAGKDAALQAAIKMFPQLNEIVSHTSRPPREGEQEGVNYFYHSKEEFEKMIEEGQMLEYTEFRNWYYGTSCSTLSETGWNIGVFNPAGIKTLSSIHEVELVRIYVAASDKTRLLRQLNREKNPDVKEIIRRFDTDEQDFKDFTYDIMIQNDKGDIYDNIKHLPLLLDILGLDINE